METMLKPSQSNLPPDECGAKLSAGSFGSAGRPSPNYWPIILLGLLLLAPFASILLAPSGRVLGEAQGDGPKAYYHYGYFLSQCWQNGVLPLWNPHIMLGVPFLGEGQAAVFHPVSFLYAFLKPSVAINWLIVLSFVLTGIFFYGYLRTLGLGRPAAWSGAATWSFSSAIISRIYAGHLNILLAFISIPMVMLFWERFRAGGGGRSLVGVALGYALMILAFYPQVLYIFSLFFLLYVLLQSGADIKTRSSTIWRESGIILRLGIFILLGVGVGAVQLLPSLDFVSRSFRQEVNLDFCGTFSFAPENLLTLIAPTFFGSTLAGTPDRYWGRNLFWEMWMYLGILPLLLAVAGAWVAPRRQRLALLGCAGVFLILGLGKHTFFFPLIYQYLPFFDLFRGSSKNTLITLFCLVTLSAYGFEALFSGHDERQRQRCRRVVLIAGGGLFLTGIVVAFSLLRQAETPGSNWGRFINWVWASGELRVPPRTQNWAEMLQTTAQGASAALIRSMVLLALSLAMLFVTLPARWRNYAFVPPLALVLLDLLGVFLPLRQTFDKTMAQAALSLDKSAQTPYPPRILVPFNPMPNLAMRSGYSSVFGLTGNTLRRYNHFISRLQHLDPRQIYSESRYVRFTPQFNMLGFEAIACKPEDLPPGARTIGTLGDKLLTRYYESNHEQRRAFLAAAPKYFSQREDALDYIFVPHENVWSHPAIERLAPRLPEQPLEKGEEVRFLSFTPNEVKLEVQAKHPRELVLCSMYEKNWQAEVNGQSVGIEPANYVFRAVQVPAGTSRVTFRYHPAAFYWGIKASIVSLILLLLLAGKPWRICRWQKFLPKA